MIRTTILKLAARKGFLLTTCNLSLWLAQIHSETMAPKVIISTRDPLVLTRGVYSSILFSAKSAVKRDIPLQYTFTESGRTPAGMVFESYPCNKPGQSVCPQVASSDGIYLDGVPSEIGSYNVTITATDPEGSKGSQSFQIVVEK